MQSSDLLKGTCHRSLPHARSQAVRPDDQIVFSIFGHFQQWEFSQKHTNCTKVSWKICPKPNKPSIYCQRFLIFVKVVEFHQIWSHWSQVTAINSDLNEWSGKAKTWSWERHQKENYWNRFYQFSVRQVDVLQLEDGLSEAAMLPVHVDVEDEKPEGPLRDAHDGDLKGGRQLTSFGHSIVTGLGDFWKLVETNFSAKIAQLFTYCCYNKYWVSTTIGLLWETIQRLSCLVLNADFGCRKKTTFWRENPKISF